MMFSQQQGKITWLRVSRCRAFSLSLPSFPAFPKAQCAAQSQRARQDIARTQEAHDAGT